MSSPVPAVWKYTFWSHISYSSDFIIVTEVVIHSLTDDESPEWYCTTGRVTTSKNFVSLRVSSVLLLPPFTHFRWQCAFGFGWMSYWDRIHGLLQHPLVGCSAALSICLLFQFFFIWYITQRLWSQWDLKGACRCLDIICIGMCMQLVRSMLPDLGTRQNSQLWS